MPDSDSRIGIEGECSLIFLWLSGYNPGLFGLETLVHSFCESPFAVDVLDASVSIPDGLVGNGVAHGYTVDFGSSVPAVYRIVGDVACKPVESGNTVERCAVIYNERLVIAPWCAEMQEALYHSVFPLLIFILEQFTVHCSHCLFDAGGCVGVEIDAERFSEVPCK